MEDRAPSLRVWVQALVRSAGFHFALAVLPLVVLLLALNGFLGGDEAAYLYFRGVRAEHPGLTTCFRLLTDWGNPVFYAAYAAVLIRGLRRRDRRLTRFALTYLAVQLLVSFLLVRVLKMSLGRPRPGEGDIHEFFTWSGSYHSLPSGHTTEVMGAALPLAMWRRRALLSLGLGAFTALVAGSRIYLGWHHPSDVAWGLVLGSYAAWLIHTYGWRD